MTSTTLPLGTDIKSLYKTPLRLLRTIIHKTCETITTRTKSLYNTTWGSSPDIRLTQEESRERDNQYVRMMIYPRHIIYHLIRVSLAKENTHIRSRTVGILASICGSAFAHKFLGGIYNTRSALRVAIAGLATGLGSWFLGTRLFNRQKRATLALRTRTILQNTPPGHLFDGQLDIRQPIRFDDLGQVVIAQRILARTDAPTLEHMYSYWQAHSIASDRE